MRLPVFFRSYPSIFITLFLWIYHLPLHSKESRHTDSNNKIQEKKQIESPEFQVGFTGQSVSSRFRRPEDEGKSLLFFEGKYKSFSGFFEQRDQRGLGAGRYSGERFFLSAGHRYKPIPTFYFLKDPEFYSAFQNPNACPGSDTTDKPKCNFGIVDQPSVPSAWVGGIFQSWNFGGFMAKNIAEKNPGIFLTLPGQIASLVYAPEKEYYSLYSGVRNFTFGSGGFQPTVNLQGEMNGTKLRQSGYTNFRFLLPTEALLIRIDHFRNFSDPQILSSDKQDPAKTEYGNYAMVSYNDTTRIDGYAFQSQAFKRYYVGGNVPTFVFPIGSICLRVRSYTNYAYDEDRKRTVTEAGSGGLSLEKNINWAGWELYYEKRSNTDRAGELKFHLKPKPFWKFEFSFLSQAEKNKLPYLFDEWSGSEGSYVSLTGKATILKVRFSFPFLALSFSGSRNPEGRGELIYANIQMRLVF